MTSDEGRGWARGPDRLRRRLVDAAAMREDSVDVPPARSRRQLRLAHVTWDPAVIDLGRIPRSSPDRARARFRAQLPELVWDAAALEGNTFTLPEVRTLLEGVTVGGKPWDDERQVLALSDAYNLLDTLVAESAFEVSKAVSDGLHARVARHEALDPGRFRGEGPTEGGGHVRLSDGSRVAGVEHGAGGVALRARMNDLLALVETLDDPRERALVWFASATRTQFYFDGNKRTARLMMCGILMSAGFDAVSVPAARRLEFNLALDRLFATDDATELMRFLTDCAPGRHGS